MIDFPLISCIMPTRNRRAFVAQAVKFFQAQDYPNKELVTLEDGEACNWDVMAGTNYHHLGASHHTIGYKRNFAILGRIARGDILCHWDDDDYYGPRRLSTQVAPLLRGEADFSAMRMSLLLDAKEGTLWTCDDCTHMRCFKMDIHYGTLMYWSHYWRQGLHYPDVQVGEDRRFVHALLATDAKLARIVDPGAFIYVLHGGNTTSDMRLAHPEGWEQVSIRQYIPEEHWKFYAGLQEGVRA